MTEHIKISDRTRVEFDLGDGALIECSVRNGKLRIESVYGRVIIEAHAANAVYVRTQTSPLPPAPIREVDLKLPTGKMKKVQKVKGFVI